MRCGVVVANCGWLIYSVRTMGSTSEQIMVAAVQLSTQADVGQNLAVARSRVLEAAGQGAKLVVLPEDLACMGAEERKREIAEELAPGSMVFDQLSAMAADAGVWLIAGGIPERSADARRPYNACAVFGPDGLLVGRYRKIHLFDADLAGGDRLMESRGCQAGDSPCCVDVGGICVGLSICYDLRFPELYRRLVDMGAMVVVVPAAFTVVTGKDHWEVLLRARAIENQVYVVAAGQYGVHPYRSTFGRSMVVDPWGLVVSQCSDGVGVCYHRLDMARVREVRRQMPVLRHRRL